jgi:A/G-specific adenine glycosylase
MLQQTRLEVVLGRFDDFLRRFPTVAALAAASEDDVTAAWSGLGYYRRARMLRAGAIDVMARFGGRIPSDVRDLLSIAGIGRYTAGAIASIAFNERAPIVDGNVARIVSRLFATHRDAWPYATSLVDGAKTPRAFNQALMELGALICKPRDPLCSKCPLRSACAAFEKNATHRYPRREKKEMVSIVVPLSVITDRDGRILLRRESLVKGMYQLPNVRAARRVGSFRHTITNRRITFDVFAGRKRSRSSDPADLWLEPARLSEVPHPSYVRKALQIAGIGLG